MSRSGDWRHWGAYGLVLLPLLFLEAVVFWRIPFRGAHPFLLPYAIAMVSAREGLVPGAAYGLGVGLFALLLGHGSSMLFVCSLVGAVTGWIFAAGLQQGFWGSLLGGLAASLLLSLLRILNLSLLHGMSAPGLFSIALWESLWSLPFFPLVYGLYRLPGGRRAPQMGGLCL